MGSRPAAADWVALNDAFREAQGQERLQKYVKRRWQQAKEFAHWLEQDSLTTLSQEQAMVLYRASGGNQSRKFSLNDLEEVRDSLDFLLHDTIKLEGRFDECASDGGGFKLDGAGKEFVSYLLCLRNPRLLGVWNGNAERLLRRMGMYGTIKKPGPVGIRYIDLMEGLQAVRMRLGLPDFREVDQLAYSVARSSRIGAGGGGSG